MTGEILESTNKRLLSDYQSMVCGIDTIEDEILEQIARFEEVKRDVEQQMSTAKKMRLDLERRYINACETIEKRQEKLRKFHEYNAHSATIFSDYESCEAEFNAGLNQVANCKAWNPATGTFDMTRLNMSWAKPINERWQARAKELENRAKAKRDNWEKQVKADGLKLQGELDKRKYMLVDINGTKRWMWVIDPTRITQEDFRVNEAYDLWIKNQIELYGRDAVLGKEEPDYLTKLAIELRDGKNYTLDRNNSKGNSSYKKADGSDISNNYSQIREYWKKDIDFKGTKVYQRDGIIDVNKVDVKGRSNLQRMEQGLAPLGPDGNPINLHHMTQRDISSIAEVEQSFHQSNSKTIHINPNSVPSGIDRKSFNKWRSDYWKNRAKDFK
ncbi:hypothetical protein ATZ33_08580 [Enterococcus silesiacus]|uniref:LHH domain-containing protein n=3 Tax=Enterococcus silesiacus TaxID=332949 RepID=A0ABM5W8D6_9ENTE|nr:hypothetical protein ATZ33_08580 [Enterococcus silesiacus]